MITPHLETVDLCKSWGPFVANDRVSLRVEQGARHALIGPNGAGKTTLVNLLAGTCAPSAGQIRLAGASVTHLSPEARARRGLARTFQVNCLFSRLSVLESMLVATCQRRGSSGIWHRTLASLRQERRDAWELLERLRLDDVAKERTDRLPYGKQRLLELALALATRPSLLILDEPASGIPTAESREMFDVIARLPRSVTVLFIEHDMDLVFRFAERVSVLVAGRILAEGSPEQIAGDQRVREVYLGEGTA
jgi:branched-chain amino acid transport system ATP-binding protein